MGVTATVSRIARHRSNAHDQHCTQIRRRPSFSRHAPFLYVSSLGPHMPLGLLISFVLSGVAYFWHVRHAASAGIVVFLALLYGMVYGLVALIIGAHARVTGLIQPGATQ